MIVADDKVGLLADISYILAKSKVNIDSIAVDVLSGKAVINMSVSDPKKGTEVLVAAGYTVEPNRVVIKIKEDELEGLTEKLKKGGVKLEESKVVTGDAGIIIVSLIVDKVKRARTILEEKLLVHDSQY